MLSLLAGFALAEGAAAQSSRAPGRQSLQALSGTYASRAPEPWGKAYGTRTFRFDRGGWALTFELAFDPQMQAKVFRFRTKGRYTVLDAAPTPDGAYAAVFHEDRKLVTLLTPDAGLAQAFGLAGCGLAVNVEKDVSKQGCAGWRPVAVCAEDHDLLRLQPDGGLNFGVRPADNDMCTADKRPTALLPAVYRR